MRIQRISGYRIFIILFGWLAGMLYPVAGQNSFLDSLEKKFDRYCHDFPWEEVFIHTDRSEYIAGENIWFESFLIDRKSNFPVKGTTLLYFEILNKNDQPVCQKRIKLVNGSGPGMITLPDTLSSGLFTIRAYTGWMKNFMPANCFTSKINIYNALNVNELTANPLLKKEEIGLRQPEPKTIVRSGYVLDISYDNRSGPELKIHVDSQLNRQPDPLCYLIVQSRGTIILKESVHLSDGYGKTILPYWKIIPGISQAAIFSPGGNLMAERYFYFPGERKSSVKLLAADSIDTRGKVSLGITGIPCGKNDSSFLSLSISTARHSSDIEKYLIFGSEFGIVSENIMIYDSLNQLSVETQKFLSGIKSRWIDWDSILSGKSPEIRFSKEIEQHYIYGKMADRESHEPARGEYVFLSTPGKNPTFQYSKTDEKGNFSFIIPVDEKMNDLIIQPGKNGRERSISLSSSFEETGTASVTEFIPSSLSPGSFISSMSVNYQIGKIYGITDADSTGISEHIPSSSKRFYGKPDIELHLDDYIKLPVMQEVFFELLSGVSLRNKKTGWELKFYDPATGRYPDIQPVMLIDGVIIDDPGIIAGLDPDVVERIDVVKEKYYVGEFGFPGIVSIITRAGDFRNVTLPDYALRLSYRVVQRDPQFRSPQYLTSDLKKSRIPDFRNTLYWNPEVSPGPDGKINIGFWSSDFRGDYEINIQGITSSGQAVSARKVIRVK